MSTYLALVADWWTENGLEGEPPVTVIGQTGMKKRACYWIQRADMAVQGQWQNWDFLCALSMVKPHGFPVVVLRPYCSRHFS